MSEPRYIDIHAHLNFAAYDDDREDVLDATLKAGVWHITVGTQYTTSQAAVDLAQKHDGVFATVGLHPIHTSASYHDEAEISGPAFTSRGEVFDPARYRVLAAHDSVVGIGECGLDYYRPDAAAIAKQRDAFSGQIALANELHKPLMLHIRTSSRTSQDAYTDALALLKEEATVPANVHFFAGSIETAAAFLDLGYTLSFTGVITFAPMYEALVSYVPLDRIQIETDAPYISPAPHRGARNEPQYVAYVAQKIAAIKGLDEELVRVQLVENSKKFFGI